MRHPRKAHDDEATRRVQVVLPNRLGVDVGGEELLDGIGSYARPDRPWLIQLRPDGVLDARDLAANRIDGVLALMRDDATPARPRRAACRRWN